LRDRFRAGPVLVRVVTARQVLPPSAEQDSHVSDLSDDRAALSRRDLLTSAALAGAVVGATGL